MPLFQVRLDADSTDPRNEVIYCLTRGELEDAARQMLSEEIGNVTDEEFDDLMEEALRTFEKCNLNESPSLIDVFLTEVKRAADIDTEGD